MIQHPDDIAIDIFAAAMKEKMAKSREKGRSGWNDKNECTDESLANSLLDHCQKGDPIDVANFAMMLFNRNAPKETLTNASFGYAQKIYWNAK